MTTDVRLDGVELGIYEKALKWTGRWEDLLRQAAAAGFSFVDISVDETPEREARLRWTPQERQAVADAIETTGVPLGGLCLSVHRRIAPGSADPDVRARAREVLVQGIDLCADLHIPVLQLAGYFAYYEDAHPNARQWYVDCLRAGAEYAARRGVLLGIENVDGTDITSISAAMAVVEEVGSPWLQLYPDLGNLAEQGLDPIRELRRGDGHMLALHAKDVRRGEPRRVPMGGGIVDWDASFAELARQHWSGRLMIEMWNDEADDSADRAAAARAFIAGKLTEHGIPIHTHAPAAPVAPAAPAASEIGDADVPASLMRLREEVWRGNLALPKAGLVAWTGGNLSARDPETGYVVIKPSGVLYDSMKPEDMVVVDLDGRIVHGHKGPSSDTASHLGVYRARPDVMSIIHTHSRYATAFAAAGRPIPCVLTAIADEFGGDVPLGEYAPIGGDAIGAEIVRAIGHAPAIIMKQHGVFTIGPTISKALQAAVMVEDIAHTVAVAEGLGELTRLPAEEIATNYDRYTNRYGTDAASEGLTR